MVPLTFIFIISKYLPNKFSKILNAPHAARSEASQGKAVDPGGWGGAGIRPGWPQFTRLEGYFNIFINL